MRWWTVSSILSLRWLNYDNPPPLSFYEGGGGDKISKYMDNRPIGVFDSGVGGLTVLKQLKDLLPNEDYIYFGDTARVPYGSKSKKTITAFAGQIVEFLLKKNVKLIVAACNTVSSNSLGSLQKKYKVPIIGVIEPGVELAFSLTRKKRIGVIGTRGTINSHKYKTLLLKKDNKLRIFEQACPLFVPIVEEGLFNSKIAELAIINYLSGLKKEKIDTLVLGCTHYPLLSRSLQEFFGSRIKLVNSGLAVSLKVKATLRINDISTGKNRKGSIYFYVSDPSTAFLNVAGSSLGLNDLKPKVITLG